MIFRHGAILLLACTLAPSYARAADASPRAVYTRALEQERVVRSGPQPAPPAQVRRVIATYEGIVRRFPASGYADNALWQAANLALMTSQQSAQDADRRAAVRLLTQLKTQYPASSLAKRAAELLHGLEAAPPPVPAEAPPPDASAAPPQPAPSATVTIRDIKRTPIPEGMRVTIEMDSETSFRAERLQNPSRVFFDLKGTRAVPPLRDATLKFNDAVVREIRLGRHPQSVTRVVFDMAGVDDYSVFTLYSPYRLVIDFKTPAAAATSGSLPAPAPIAPPVSPVASLPPTTTALPDPPPIKFDDARTANRESRANDEARTTNRDPRANDEARTATHEPRLPTIPPAANSDGKFSIARQLGLGVSRVVIDAGHGGHDPGAQSNGIDEAELTLDVAQRLSRLLQKQPGVEVVMTRDTDVFVPLEERTAIANREGADLFLSIHANASRSPHARGVETYFLNFATNPDAEAVAARENSASGRAMHSLPDIVRAIALNNKIDESRDFADMVQRSMVRRLATRNKQLKDLGVKQAPFVVLIGAAMPSVLAEISFVTHRQEGQLLKTAAYRQQIAEALLDAVLKYQQSLKKPRGGT
jgi:N-acetylmuramoyl-L-alanine amidase